MRSVSSIFKTATAAVALALGVSAGTQAAVWSSTKVELLYGYDYKRGPGFAEVDEAIFTIANASGLTWGDSFFFSDVTDFDDRDGTSANHMEFGPRLSLLRTFGDGQWKEGPIKDIYAIVQIDYDNNPFSNKWTGMGGASVDWNVPGFRFVKTHVQYRDDPTKSGSSIQFNLVWNKGFKVGEQNFSFEGFLDWTSSEGNGESNLLTQPQLLWHANKHIAVGIEYQYWQNRLGIDGLDEKAPQLMVRWTF